ncbi:hypothetical protein FVR03_21590 [Pontibacter qinzhouensis]|uniref:Uncharacterized protein n=1 Tax=Pontibacter qinzhouensis TaxID=2603253 RepID=A0A5C8IZM9_9BACT|nr:hypothetical protein [Pontibacter qinzhouensis]TXK26690.1 hypothetical protein FVR03_21590 [Pontibacter qinzhouensis]
MKKDYTLEAEKVARAIDIAIEAFMKTPPPGFTDSQVNQFVKVYKDYKESALNPLPGFRKLASLKYIVNDILTFFQESKGEAVDSFWEKVNEENLGYKREDQLRKILDRGKIRGRIEYELAVDSIVPAEQEGSITKEDASLLGKLISEFEFGRKKTGNKA